MDDDVKATAPEQVVDANQADPPKVEENVNEFTQMPAVSPMGPIGPKVAPSPLSDLSPRYIQMNKSPHRKRTWRRQRSRLRPRFRSR